MTVQSRIQELVRQRAGNHVDTVWFVDQLLALVDAGGEIRCTFAGPDRLRFEVGGQEPFEVPMDRAKGKLRQTCARLAVLCGESSGQEAPLYGGDGIIKKE